MRSPLLLAAAASLAACASRTTVVPSGSGLSLAPRPAGCGIEFYRAKPPDRPFDEIATLLFESRDQIVTLKDAQEAMRAQACAAGADAIVVTRDFLLGSMIGVAVGYRDTREQHRADAALRQIARTAWEGELAEARRRVGAPAGYLPAKVVAAALLRSSPRRQAPVADDVAAGLDVWSEAAASGGWRRIWISRDRSGFVEADAVRLVDPPAPAAPAAREGAPARTGS